MRLHMFKHLVLSRHLVSVVDSFIHLFIYNTESDWLHKEGIFGNRS